MSEKETEKVNTEEISEINEKETEKTENACENKKGCSREAKKEKKQLEEKEAKIAELEQKLSEENDKYLRMMAEYDNFRKRVAKEKESIYTDAACDTCAEILPIIDNLDRALEAEADKESGMYKGVEMIKKQCEEIFAKLGISEIEAMGKTFDPNLHNAVMHDEDAEKGENEITAVFQKGYKKGEKVLRYAVVKVSN